jgi:hypothetical protein
MKLARVRSALLAAAAVAAATAVAVAAVVAVAVIATGTKPFSDSFPKPSPLFRAVVFYFPEPWRRW